MFKLESYLTPWLLGYLDKYVKLKPEDFQLSLWGGDAVFSKLDLRLNIIENLTNIPITFKSGVIHELRIHIPWTRITSEPVVVTINTLEFVAKLKDASSPQSNNSTPLKSESTSGQKMGPSSSSSNLANENASSETKTPAPPPPPPPQQQQIQPPTGYMQSIIAKILANVCVIINNVIVKFVEDDIVLSINMKSAECFSVNSLWEKAFVEVNAANIDLRKVLQLNDVTICLDRLDRQKSNPNSSGGGGGKSSRSASSRKINFYQDPLVYRCSIQSRLDLKYSIQPTMNNTDQLDANQQLKLIKLDFYCSKFNMSITDQQLPMLMRLIELAQAITNGTLKLRPGSSDEDELVAEVNNDAAQRNSLVVATPPPDIKVNPPAEQVPPSPEVLAQQDQDQEQQGWISWAWSYVPSVSTIMNPMEDENGVNPDGTPSGNSNFSSSSNLSSKNAQPSIQCLIGVYFDEFNLTFKLTQQIVSASKKFLFQDPTATSASAANDFKNYTFNPFLNCTLKGIATEINLKNEQSHIIFGVSYICVKSLNECCCKLCPSPSAHELVFVEAGQEDLEERTYHYLSNSLFDLNDVEQQQQQQSSSAVVNAESDSSTTTTRNENDNNELVANVSPSHAAKSRTKTGAVDENYGLVRFGAFFMDLLTKRSSSSLTIDESLNPHHHHHGDLKPPSSGDVNSLYLVFYGIQINLSANLLHRALKIWDCLNSHSYTEPYGDTSSSVSASQEANTSSLDGNNLNEDQQHLHHQQQQQPQQLSAMDAEKLAKSLEKHLPFGNLTILVKEPIIKLHPYSHYLIAPIAASNRHATIDSCLVLKMKTFCYSRTNPLDENLLYQVVSKLTQPSKKLMYDCYYRNHITLDSISMSLLITTNQHQQQPYHHEAPILEPCYVEAQFNRVIMGSDKWTNQYLPLVDISLEMPKIKLNLFKQQLFILNDYLDCYLYPSLDGSMFAQIKDPYVNKTRMKKAKIRQIIYKRLMEDYLSQSQFKKSEILRISINDLKFKISTTKILHLIQLDCNMLNMHMNKDNNSEEIISLFETSNKIRGKHSNIKDFLVLRAQLPLQIDPHDSLTYFVPDPLFVYANLNEINIQVLDPFLQWINYAPKKSDSSELLNLLVLDMLDDLPAALAASTTADPNADLNPDMFIAASSHARHHTTSSIRSYSTRIGDAATIDSISSASVHVVRQKPINYSTLKKTKRSVVTKAKSTGGSDESFLVVASGESTSNIHKPTLIDAYFDLLKSIHIQICLKPINIGFKSLSLSNSNSNKMLVVNLPQVNIKTAATKCDLEEELMSSKLVELPCSYLRACERTTAKLPWIIELKSLCSFVYSDYPHDYLDMSLFRADSRRLLLTPLDTHMVFSVRPAYNQYDNLLSSLSFVLNIECARLAEIELRKSHADLIIEWCGRISTAARTFESRIDVAQYEEIIKNSSAARAATHERKAAALEAFETTFDEDDNRSYSTLSIMKEYDLSSLDEDLENNSTTNEYVFYPKVHNLGEFEMGSSSSESASISSMSSSSALNNNNKNQIKRPVKIKKSTEKTPKHHNYQSGAASGVSDILSPVVSIMREKNDDQVKLNFTLSVLLAGFQVSLVNDTAKEDERVRLPTNTILVTRIQTQADMNNIYEKLSFRVKKFEIFSNDNNVVVLTSDPGVFESRVNSSKIKPEKLDTNQKPLPTFLELTFTRALISNFNKKLNNNELEMGLNNNNNASGNKSSNNKSTNKRDKFFDRFEAHARSHQTEQKWIAELNVNVHSLDVMFDAARLGALVVQTNALMSCFEASERTTLIPLVAARHMPLLNIECDRARLMIPMSQHPAAHLLVYQLDSLNLTSQVENPLIRTFPQNESTSTHSSRQTIYDRAKSSGLIYRPGFIFEDRQYVIDFKTMTLFLRDTTACTSRPLLDSFGLRATLALPIVFDRYLINGYLLEISLGPHINIYASDEDIRSIKDTIVHSGSILNEFSATSNSSPVTTSSSASIKEPLQLVPIDLFLTCENLNVFFTRHIEDAVRKRKILKPILSIDLIQPYISLIMHEKAQKLEVSLFDIEIKRGVREATSDFISSEPSIIRLTPCKSDFQHDLLETKRGEKNARTGITAGFLSFRLNNFGKLICGRGDDVEEAASTEKQPVELDPTPIVVCDECLRCYQVSNSSASNDSRIDSQLCLGRPTRFCLDLEFIDELIDYFAVSFPRSSSNSSSTKNEIDEETSNFLAYMQRFFDINMSISTCQLVFVLEFARVSQLDVNLSLNGFSLLMNKSESASHDCTLDTTSRVECLRADLVLTDFLCTLDNSVFTKKIEKANTTSLHVMGPLSLKLAFDYSPSSREMFAFADLGSFSLTCNRFLVDYFINIQNILNNHFNKQSSDLHSVQKVSTNFDKTKSELEKLTFTTREYQDDLRNGSLTYTIIDESTFKSTNTSGGGNNKKPPNQPYVVLSNLCVPRINEIKCLDDLDESMTTSSYVCWRYARRRTLKSLKIMPLPFVGGESRMGVTSTGSTTVSVKMIPKCYLEAFDECTKTFVVVSSFEIEEGVAVNLTDLNSLAFFAKIWRIRLSREAQKLIYASSLVASTRVDSIELEPTIIQDSSSSSSPLSSSGTKNCFHAHFKLVLAGLEVKVNSLGPNSLYSDLLVLNLSQFSSRLLLDRVLADSSSTSKVAALQAVRLFSLGQFQADYCEYRFITMRPLLENFQFKVLADYCSPRATGHELVLKTEMDTLNFLTSQSTVICLRQLKKEWLEDKKDSINKAMQFYMIYNDTDVAVNVKQSDTEETCPIQPGGMLAYSWRSHKKRQLMQLYVPKYKLTSSEFQINRNGIDEIRCLAAGPSSSPRCISFIVRVETRVDRWNRSLGFMSRSNSAADDDISSFKKFIIIQARFCVLNMLNLDVSVLSVAYSIGNEEANINAGSIPKYSRSSHTHALLETEPSLSSNRGRLVELISLRVNESTTSVSTTHSKRAEFLNKLINGISLYDSKQKIKYWINLYENKLTFGGVGGANKSDNKSDVSQLCLVLTPVLVLCSYLPYELDVKLNNELKSVSIKSNAISYCSSSVDFDVTKIELRFDRLSRASSFIEDDEDEEMKERILEYTNRNPNWFEVEKECLEDGEFNLALCRSFVDKRLVFMDYFKYKWTSTDPTAMQIDQAALNSLEVSTNVNNQANRKLQQQQQQKQPDDNQSSPEVASSSPSNPNSWISGELQVSKSICWPFSKTIRLDIRPVCLCVNKTDHPVLLIQKTSSHELDYDIEPNLGQICLSDLSSEHAKKYKLRITLDEYHTNTRELNLIKHEISYESDWFEIKEEQSSPFYREQSASTACLYASNKCWIDLKLYPNMKSARLKLIYLTMSNEIWNHHSMDNPTTKRQRRDGDNESTSSNNSAAAANASDIWTRIISIQSKFVVRNKSPYELTTKVVDSHASVTESRVHRFLDTESRRFIGKNQYQSIDMVLNLRNFYLKDAHHLQPQSNEEFDPLKAEFEREKEKLDDLFYLRIQELQMLAPGAASNSVPVVQSRPVVLTLREKALRQLNSSQSHTDDSPLLSRQCCSVYLQQQQISTTMSFVLTQKLMVNQSGQLLIGIELNRHNLVHIHNETSRDVWVWPRVSTNFILETYIRNCAQLDEKKLAQQRKFRPMIEKNKRTIDVSRSLAYMHVIPARSVFKFSYDFVGTNQFPIENLNEQVFFMFGLLQMADLQTDSQQAAPQSPPTIQLSQNLCKIFERRFEIAFEDAKNQKLFYWADPSESACPSELTQIRYVSNTQPPSSSTETSSVTSINNNSSSSATTRLKASFHVERFTWALNDDHLSQLYQTEILRVTLDNLAGQIDVDSPRSFAVNTCMGHIQVDNQMFDLDTVTQDRNTDNEFNKVAQKYDFPVIFVPREKRRSSSSSSRKETSNVRNYFQSLEFFRSWSCANDENNANNDKDDYFMRVKLKFCTPDPSSVPFRLVRFELDLNAFDVYLEDYLIYNLAEIGLEFFELASSSSQELAEVRSRDVRSYQVHDLDLSLVSQPLLTVSELRISRIDALVSLQTSLKIYLASYKMPIVFDEFIMKGLPLVVHSSPQIVKQLTNHYLTSLLFRAGWLLGSLELIGSPTAFLQQVSNGVLDFIRMPYQGMRESGATGLVNGFSSGFLSLVQNLSAGTITSLTSFASFVSRNMDILSFDPSHLARQERLRHQSSTSILEVSSSFLITIMGAIGGLANQPIVSIQESDSIIKGVSKGLIGLVTKPVGAVAELVNQTGQGLLRITGVNRLPPNENRLERRPFNRPFSYFSISSSKLHSKLLHQMTSSRVHVMLESVYTLSGVAASNRSDVANLSGCYLALTDDVLYIVDKQEDMLMRAFYVSQIELTRQHDDATLLVVTLLNRSNPSAGGVPTAPGCGGGGEDLAIDRLVDFVLQTSKPLKHDGSTRNNSVSEEEASLLTAKPLLVSHFMRFNSQASALAIYFKHHRGLPCCKKPAIPVDLEPSSSTTTVTATIRDAEYLTNKTINEAMQKLRQQRRRQSSSEDGSFTGQQHQQQQQQSATVKTTPLATSPQNDSLPRLHQFARTNDTNNTLSADTDAVTPHNKQFFYYVDPRLLDNFISVFASLKRKSLNRDFQF